MTPNAFPISRPDAGMQALGGNDAAVKPSDPAYRAKVEAAAVQFESLFIAQLLNEMKKTTDQMKESSGFADTTGDAMMEHANRTVADAIARQRAFGIADTLITQMLPADTLPTKHNP